MSEDVLTSGCEMEKLYLPRRLKEILDDKGDAFTVPAFSRRIGMSESTLYRCLNGERFIKPSELEKIAEGVHMPISRIKQEDNAASIFNKMRALVTHKVNFEEALNFALDFLPKAAGCTEKYETLNCLGVIYYFLNKIKPAINAWLEALPYARQLLHAWGETKPLIQVTKNLIIGYSKSNNYSKLSIVLDEVQSEYKKHSLPPDFLSSISYAKAVSALHVSEFEDYEANMLEHLEHASASGDPVGLGIAIHNVAYMYYKIKDFKQSKQKFEEAIELFKTCKEPRVRIYLLTSFKDYAKALFALGQTEAALKVIDDSLPLTAELYTIRAKLLILKSIYSGDVAFADEVLHLDGIEPEIKKIALEILMNDCSKTGDAEGLMKYYKLGDELSSSSKNEMGESL